MYEHKEGGREGGRYRILKVVDWGREKGAEINSPSMNSCVQCNLFP